MKPITRLSLIGAASMLIVATGLTVTSCSTPASGTAKTSAPPEKKLSATGMPVATGGAQLWAQNCGHCHNIRSPNSYSDAQWEVAVLHMRVRANLTAEEHKQILAFLKSAH